MSVTGMRRRAAWIAIGVPVLAFGTVVAPATAHGPGEDYPDDPEFSVGAAALDASVDCDAFDQPTREPVLLVHGTFTKGHEEFAWNYELLLRGAGYDVCVVTYPDRGFADQQVSAEYVVHAILKVHEESGRQVDVVGHSQGAVLPRWAVKFWESARDAVDDLVMLAGPNHGVLMASNAGQSPLGMPESFYQFDPGSNFLAALNSGDETPGDISYSSIYTATDELVQPVYPEPTAAVSRGDGPEVANVLVQDVCPGRAVDHVTIGTTDRAVQALVLDALSRAGPVDVARAGLAITCTVPDQQVSVQTLPAMFAGGRDSFSGGFPDWHEADEEPELKEYARN